MHAILHSFTYPLKPLTQASISIQPIPILYATHNHALPNPDVSHPEFCPANVPLGRKFSLIPPGYSQPPLPTFHLLRMYHIRNSARPTFYLIRVSHIRTSSSSTFHPDIHSRHSVRPTFHLLRMSHSRHSARPTLYLIWMSHIRI